MRTEPDDHVEHEAQGDEQADEPAPRHVKCPMLACGRTHELPPDLA
ncbi:MULTISPECIES: hypothetical protein [Streptomyces]|nr:hypothetical protein [Streptomyces sp. FT1]MCX5457752.1 hypothetical protein [Streptomyces sp. FT1]